MTASALIISAPGSGHGKTLITAGLAQALLEQGKNVVVFKMGPDYLDPMFIRQATGLDVRQLDYWMLKPDEIAAELGRAAASADHVLIEGVMGLFDGRFSVASLAREFGIPVVVAADASGMAQTFGALMQGLADYDPQVNVAAVLANRVGSANHGAMLEESVRPPLRYLGWVERDEALVVPERHLGIHTDARQICVDTTRAMAAKLQPCLDKLPWQPLQVDASALQCPLSETRPLQGRRIAIARDAAFSFLYPANVDLLRRAGAEVCFFSPLADEPVPECDSLYLPGGYPELHLQALSDNRRSAESVRAHIVSGKPCLAECGGMLYLQTSLAAGEQTGTMLGLLPGEAVVGKRLARLGYQGLDGTILRGHTFHYAALSDLPRVANASFQDGREGEPIYRLHNTLASFVHWYFASDPLRIVEWLQGRFSGVDD